MNNHLLISFWLLAVSAPAFAQSPVADDEGDKPAPQTEIVVTARRLDAARTRIESDLGASTYTLTNDAIENRPGGETRDLGSILVQVPGVRREGSGRLVVRGAPGVQYRLNNIILPDGVADFGETLSARLADRTMLITGALPAQYGLATGGVINITTKSGLYEPGGQAELYGGSHRTIEPAFEWGGSSGSSSLFASGSFKWSDIGIASLDGSTHPLHDKSREIEGFGFAQHILDAGSRVSLIVGSSNERKQIPGLAVPGLPDAERRHGEDTSSNHYAIASYQKSDEQFSLQASVFGLLSHEAIAPDETLSVAVDGVSRRISDSRRSAGTQVEGAYSLGSAHTLRSGLLLSVDRERKSERSRTPSTLYSATSIEHRTSVSFFVQDEWQLTSRVTFNGGVRLDQVSDVDHKVHVGPRASFLWAAPAGLTAHAGYARYYVAPLLGDAAPRSILFGGATATQRPSAETDDYFDLGAQQKLGGLTLGVDGYWRNAHDLLGQRNWEFSPISRSFNYRKGRLRGVEISMTYAEGPITAWSNLVFAQARGREIVTDRAEFTPAELANVATHNVPLDQDQHATGSAGLSWRLGHLLLSTDLLFGSGARRTVPSGPVNGARLPAYATVDAAAVYRLRVFSGHALDLRLDVNNLLDARYALRDGTALGGGAPQWGERRGVFVGLEQAF